MRMILSVFKGFSILRWIHLTAGFVVIGEAIQTGNFIISFIGITLVFMALKKTECLPAAAGKCTKH